MSSRKGGAKKGAPAHANKVAWKPNRNVKKNETELGGKRRPFAAIAGVCFRCHDQIEWKRKYGKYKPLIEPAKCKGCTKRKVQFAYHALCKDCASSKAVCAKCCRSEPLKEPQGDSPEEEERKLQEALANLRERDRRTLLRAMNKGGTTSSSTQKLIERSKEQSKDNDSSGSELDSSVEEGEEEGEEEEEEGEEEDEEGEEDGKKEEGEEGVEEEELDNEDKEESNVQCTGRHA